MRQPVGLGLVQRALSEEGDAPSAASVEHVNGPTLPVISRSYVDTEFHGSLNSPVVNFADSNESLPFDAHPYAEAYAALPLVVDPRKPLVPIVHAERLGDAVLNALERAR